MSISFAVAWLASLLLALSKPAGNSGRTWRAPACSRATSALDGGPVQIVDNQHQAR